MKIYVPYPVKCTGVLEGRSGVIGGYREKAKSDASIVCMDRLPNAQEIGGYFTYVKKNDYSREYVGELITAGGWKFEASMADFMALERAVVDLVDGEKEAYVLTNCAGHHADNRHYELFCPLNQLFFIVELLNYQDNFPSIYWLDTDAHFGNGDKAIYGKYSAKMAIEGNNLRGISIHNDAGDTREGIGGIEGLEGYVGFGYSPGIGQGEFLGLVESALVDVFEAKYIIWFVGTDISNNDYGGNKNIELSVLKPLAEIVRQKAKTVGAKLLVVQAGGTRGENIEEVVRVISNQ